MFCTSCEFEIKGDDRKECPICGGPLIDYSEVETSSDAIKSTREKDRWGETAQESKETTPFDLGKALEIDGDTPLQKPDKPTPLLSQGEPEGKPEPTDEEGPAEDTVFTAFEKSRWETDQWEETTPFDLGKALEVDGDTPLQESEEHTPLLSQGEPEEKPEAVAAAQSKEGVVPDTADSNTILPEQIIAAAQQSEIASLHSSRKQSVISAMVVFVFVAAIATIAIVKPQLNFYPVIGQLKTQTEKTVVKILSIVTQKEGEKVVVQKTPEGSTRVQQKQRVLASGDANTDKRVSRLEELSLRNKGKEATVKKQLESVDPKPLAQQETSYPRIASLKETSSPLKGKDMQPFEMKPSTKNTSARKTVPGKPVVTKASQSRLYSIHTGSFKNKEVAVGECTRLKKMGFQPYIQTVNLEKGQRWHRIKVGSYRTREEAENTQTELRQQVPELKSYIMRRETKQKKTAAKKEGETSITTAGIPPFAAGQPQRELPHGKSDVLETAPPLKEILTPQVEQPLTEMKAASYLIPPSEEVPQTVSEDGASFPLLKESLLPEAEQPLTEMEEKPSTTLLVEEEISQEEAGSIGTIPADTDQKENHPSTMNIVPENIVHEGEEAVTPLE